MNIEFVDAYPFAEMGTKLRQLCRGARRVEGAVAFVTRFGVERWLELLNLPDPSETRLVVSVRFPTALAELCRLEPKMAGKLFIHTGYSEPHEERADRGQFHSKIVVIEYGDGKAAVVIGSHNWTENALCGINMEAAVILRGQANEPVVVEARRHIAECAARSEPFDPNRLRYYQTIQSKLHAGPATADFDNFAGFEPLDALIIHAEDETQGGLPDPMRLFLRVTVHVPDGFFANGRRVQLFVHPKGSLFGRESPSHPAVVYDGTVTMQNTVADAPVGQRPVNCRIDDLERPRLQIESGGNIPALSGERLQVVARLERLGTAELPIFHSAAQPPRLKLDVEEREIDRDRPIAQIAFAEIPDQSRGPRADGSQSARKKAQYFAPTHLLVKCTVRMPAEWGGGNVEARLRNLLHGSEFLKQEDVPEVSIEKPAAANMLNPFVYLAHYRLTEESISRIRRQPPLIE